jgi:hypothetical protein
MNDWLSRRDFLVGATGLSLASRLVALASAGDRVAPEELTEFDYGAVEMTGGPSRSNTIASTPAISLSIAWKRQFKFKLVLGCGLA